MSSTDAQKKAVKKWTGSRDNITIRLEKSVGAAIRKAAEEAGISVTQYILNCVNVDLSLDSPTINQHLSETGETLIGFLQRAVSETIERDHSQRS